MNGRQRMKIVIDIPNEEYERVIAGKWEGNPLADYIEKGIPYEDKIEQITDLLETEWGYEGIKEDVEKIMRGE
jgi:hypothetical protein